MRKVERTSKSFCADLFLSSWKVTLIFAMLWANGVNAQREVMHFHAGLNVGVPYAPTAYYYLVKTGASLEWDKLILRSVWVNVGSSISRTWPSLNSNIFLRMADVYGHILIFNPEKHRLGFRGGIGLATYWSKHPYTEVGNGYAADAYINRYSRITANLGVMARIGKYTDVSLICTREALRILYDIESNNLIVLSARFPLWTVTRSAPDANGERARTVIPFWRRERKSGAPED